MEFVHISAQNYLEIMAFDQKIFATSQAFTIAHTIIAQRMTHTEAILAQIQEHLGLPPIPLSPQAVVAPTSPAPPPTAPVAASANPTPTVLPTASTALPADHLAVPTQSQDEDDVPSPAAT